MLSNAFESPRTALGCQGTSWLKPRCCIPTLKTVTCCCQTLQVKVMATLQGLYPKQQDQHGWAETKCRYLQCLPWFARFLGRRAPVHSGRTYTSLIRTELARASISSQCELCLWTTTWGLFKNCLFLRSLGKNTSELSGGWPFAMRLLIKICFLRGYFSSTVRMCFEPCCSLRKIQSKLLCVLSFGSAGSHWQGGRVQLLPSLLPLPGSWRNKHWVVKIWLVRHFIGL